jgi:hypothetical protein
MPTSLKKGKQRFRVRATGAPVLVSFLKNRELASPTPAIPAEELLRGKSESPKMPIAKA